MERIVKRSKYLLLEVNTNAASDIRLGVESAQARWQAMFNRVESLVNRHSKLTDRAEKFEQLRQEVYSFLTEAELKLISLDPYTSDDPPRVQLENLKVGIRDPLRFQIVGAGIESPAQVCQNGSFLVLRML